MSIAKPYFRTVRQFTDGDYMEGGRWGYVMHPSFAIRPSFYVRAYSLLQDDLKELFKFIEPSDANLSTYSFRTLELLLRASVEVEANCKAILSANKCSKNVRDMDMKDYAKVEFSHYLSQYRVKIPYWTGTQDVRQPFLAWSSTTGTRGQAGLDWYQRYNRSKHDRAGALHEATLSAVLDAVAGLHVLLTAQFLNIDFGPDASYLSLNDGASVGFEDGIGGYLRVEYPKNVPIADRYDFDWQQLKLTTDPFEPFDFDSIQ